jgi:hypothetical protein
VTRHLLHDRLADLNGIRRGRGINRKRCAKAYTGCGKHKYAYQVFHVNLLVV